MSCARKPFPGTQSPEISLHTDRPYNNHDHEGAFLWKTFCFLYLNILVWYFLRNILLIFTSLIYVSILPWFILNISYNSVINIGYNKSYCTYE